MDGTGTGATREAKIWISAAPGHVWSMVSNVTRMGDWSPETVACQWLDGATGPKVGVRFKGENRRGRSKWSTTCQITACEPAKEFEFVTVPGSPETRWRYAFTPAAGGTEVTESFEVLSPLSRFSKVLTRVATGVKDREADMEQGMHETLARLRDAAEAI